MTDTIIKNLPFVDAQLMREKHLETFRAPNFEELNTLLPGQYAKVCLEGERFWIQIVSITGDTIIGRVIAFSGFGVQRKLRSI